MAVWYRFCCDTSCSEIGTVRVEGSYRNVPFLKRASACSLAWNICSSWNECSTPYIWHGARRRFSDAQHLGHAIHSVPADVFGTRLSDSVNRAQPDA
jgi:hypothetical protein